MVINKQRTESITLILYQMWFKLVWRKIQVSLLFYGVDDFGRGYFFGDRY